MSNGPAISILMPSYNGDPFIREAVEGALRQMRADDELLIQDGGSTDGSIERLRQEFGATYPQLKIVSAEDAGQADALNRALARAANPVMGWLNADDRLFDGALDAVRRAWVADPALDVVYGRWTIFDADGVTMRICRPRDYTRSSMTRRPHIFSGSIFMRTALVHDSGGFDPELYMCMDLDLLLRLAAGKPRYAQTSEIVAGFRWHEDSKTGATDFRVVREGYTVRRRYAHGVGPTLEALAFSGAHVAAHLATPVRRSQLYSAMRVRRAASGH